MPVPPILFDEEAGHTPVAPDFAQHTDELLTGIGLAPDDLGRLRSAGVIA